MYHRTTGYVRSVWPAVKKTVLINESCSQRDVEGNSKVKFTTKIYWTLCEIAHKKLSVSAVCGLNDSFISLSYIFSTCPDPSWPRCEHPSHKMPLFLCISFSCVVHTIARSPVAALNLVLLISLRLRGPLHFLCCSCKNTHMHAHTNTHTDTHKLTRSCRDECCVPSWGPFTH